MGWHPHALGRSLAALLYLGAWLAASGPMVTYSYFGHVTDNRGSAIPVGTSMLLQLTYPVDLRGLPLDREERIFEYAHDRAAGGVGTASSATTQATSPGSPEPLGSAHVP